MSGQRSTGAAQYVCLEVGQPFNPFRLFNGIFIPDALARQKGISSGAKMIYGRLGRYAGENGECYPAVPTLAAEIGASERQTQRYLAELERERFIRRVPRFSKSGQSSNAFQFLWHPILEAAVTKMSPEGVTDPSPEGVTDLSPKESQSEESQIEEKATNKRISGSASQIPRSDASSWVPSPKTARNEIPKADFHTSSADDHSSSNQSNSPRPWTERELAQVRNRIVAFWGREPEEGFEISVMLRARGASAAAVCELLERKFANKRLRPGGRYAPKNQNWFLTVIENEFSPGHLPECPSSAPSDDSENEPAVLKRGIEVIELADAPRSVVESVVCSDCGRESLVVYTDGTVQGCGCRRNTPPGLRPAREIVSARSLAGGHRTA
jgi:hypothetical protein